MACMISAYVALGVAIDAWGNETAVIEVKAVLSAIDSSDPDLGAVTLVWTDYGSPGGNNDLTVDGQNANNNSIDGQDHDLDGNLTGSGDHAGITTNVSTESEILSVDGVTLSGSSPTTYEINDLNVEGLVNAYAAQADVSVTSTTTYNGGSVGAVDNFQVVFVDNAKLVLKGDFNGYGVIAIKDTTSGGGQAEVILRDGATWHGIIVGYSGDTSGNSDRLLLTLKGGGGSTAQVIGGVIMKGDDVQVKLQNSAELLFSSEAIDEVVAQIGAGGTLEFERWREIE